MRVESGDHAGRDAVIARLRELLRDRLSSAPPVRVKAYQWRENSHARNKPLITISIKVKGDADLNKVVKPVRAEF